MGKYWFRLAGSAVIIGQCTLSGKYVSDSVSVSGMVSSSKAFRYMASHSISISSTVSTVHGETWQEFAHSSNSYKHIVFLYIHSLNNDHLTLFQLTSSHNFIANIPYCEHTPLMQWWSAWWELLPTAKSASDIISTYFHSQFCRKYSLL